MLKEEATRFIRRQTAMKASPSFAPQQGIGITIIDVTMPGKDGKHVFNSVLELDPAASIIMIPASHGITSGLILNAARGGSFRSDRSQSTAQQCSPHA